MTESRSGAATRGDISRIYEVRHGTAESRLTNATAVTHKKVIWYTDKATFRVSENEMSEHGFTCVNRQTSYVWALFLIDTGQGRGQCTAFLDVAMARLRKPEHRQAILSTDEGSKAETFTCRAAGGRWTKT